MAFIGSKSEEFKSLQWNASQHIRYLTMPLLALGTFICKLKSFRLSGFARQDARFSGFNENDLMEECVRFYTNTAVKLRFEFVDTDVTQIVRDIRFTFFSKLGILGKAIK